MHNCNVPDGVEGSSKEVTGAFILTSSDTAMEEQITASWPGRNARNYLHYCKMSHKVDTFYSKKRQQHNYLTVY